MDIEHDDHKILQLLTIAHLKVLIASTNGVKPVALNEAFEEAVDDYINYSGAYGDIHNKGLEKMRQVEYNKIKI